MVAGTSPNSNSVRPKPLPGVDRGDDGLAGLPDPHQQAPERHDALFQLGRGGYLRAHRLGEVHTVAEDPLTALDGENAQAIIGIERVERRIECRDEGCVQRIARGRARQFGDQQRPPPVHDDRGQDSGRVQLHR